MSDIEYSVITSDVIKSFDCTKMIVVLVYSLLSHMSKFQRQNLKEVSADNRLSLAKSLVTTGCHQQKVC